MSASQPGARAGRCPAGLTRCSSRVLCGARDAVALAKGSRGGRASSPGLRAAGGDVPAKGHAWTPVRRWHREVLLKLQIALHVVATLKYLRKPERRPRTCKLPVPSRGGNIHVKRAQPSAGGTSRQGYALLLDSGAVVTATLPRAVTRPASQQEETPVLGEATPLVPITELRRGRARK